MGKAASQVQAHLRGETAEKHNHSSAGMRWLWEHRLDTTAGCIAAQMGALAIGCHHSGRCDIFSLDGKDAWMERMYAAPTAASYEESKGIRPIRYNNGSNDLSIYTYLTHVEYQIKAHFEWNENRPDLAGDRNENKHYWIAKRMLERGGRRDIFLGTRECQGYIEPCEFQEGSGAYDNTPPFPLGMMLHGITYGDEDGSGQMSERFWRPVMRNGIIEFIRPEECPVIRPIRQQKSKTFLPGKNFQPCEDLYQEVTADGTDRTML